MKQRLLTSEEAEQYKSLADSYHPNGQVVYNFARSNFAVIAGPTGAGKDTLREKLLENKEFIKILSTTSRPMREGEKDGVEYHFCNLEFFDQGLEERRFLQMALVHNQQLAALDFADIESLNDTQIGLAILVVHTEMGLRRLNSNMKTVFVVPPSLEILKQRIQNERIMDPDELGRRMQAAKDEMAIANAQKSYFCIINDDINRASNLASTYFKSGAKEVSEDESAREVIKQLLKELE